MSLVPLLTHRGPGQLLYTPYYSTGSLTASTVTTSTLNTYTLNAVLGNISTLSTFVIDLDGQVLTATPTELLLNGVPVATQSSLSTIAEWSYDPAISTVQMGGNDINAAGTISSVNVRAGIGFFGNLVAFNALFVSTQTSTISSLVVQADSGLYSTLAASNAITAPALETSSFTTSTLLGESGTLSSLNGISSINGQPITFYEPGSVSTVSTFSDVFTSSLVGSTFFAADWISTPNLYVSSINGSEFNSTGITVQVAGVSSLFANSISSLGAELRTAFVSTLQFNPSLGGVNLNLGLGSILGNVVGWGAGVLGAATGVVGLGTAMYAVASGRQQDFIDNTRYELINGTTQLQFSTIGSEISSIYRVSDSVSPDQIPGSTLYYSTILSPGTLAVRSVSDPINTLSTPNSTIQAFGPWAVVPPELTTSTFVELNTQFLNANRINTSSLTGGEAGLLTIGGPILYLSTAATGFVYTDGEMDALRFESRDVWTSSIQTSSITCSTLTAAGVVTAAGLFGGGGGLQISTVGSIDIVAANQVAFFNPGGVYLQYPGNNGISYASTLSTQQTFADQTTTNAATVSSLAFAQQGAFGLSSLMYLSTAQLSGFGTSTTTYLNTDMSLGQNDFFCQQIRLGYLNPSSQPSEIIFHSPNNTQRAFNLGNSDQTIRIQSTANATGAGYLLDTLVNPPLFSTINGQVNLVSYFPSTTASTIGYSSITKMNPVTLYGNSTLAGGSVNIVFSPPYADSNEYSVLLTYKDTAGGAPLHANILSVSSFSANGTATNSFFWQIIGRV